MWTVRNRKTERKNHCMSPGGFPSAMYGRWVPRNHQVTGSPLHSRLLNEKETYPPRHSKGLQQRSQAHVKALSHTGSVCVPQTSSEGFIRRIFELLVPASGQRMAPFPCLFPLRFLHWIETFHPSGIHCSPAPWPGDLRGQTPTPDAQAYKSLTLCALSGFKGASRWEIVSTENKERQEFFIESHSSEQLFERKWGIKGERESRVGSTASSQFYPRKVFSGSWAPEAQETRPGRNCLWSVLNEHLAGSFLKQTEHRLHIKTKAWPQGKSKVKKRNHSVKQKKKKKCPLSRNWLAQLSVMVMNE